MLTFSEVGNTEAHETKRRTSQPDSGLATIPTRSFWPRTILWGMNTNMGDLDLFYHEVYEGFAKRPGFFSLDLLFVDRNSSVRLVFV
jgi:hypothetical protein